MDKNKKPASLIYITKQFSTSKERGSLLPGQTSLIPSQDFISNVISLTHFNKSYEYGLVAKILNKKLVLNVNSEDLKKHTLNLPGIGDLIYNSITANSMPVNSVSSIIGVEQNIVPDFYSLIIDGLFFGEIMDSKFVYVHKATQKAKSYFKRIDRNKEDLAAMLNGVIKSYTKF